MLERVSRTVEWVARQGPVDYERRAVDLDLDSTFQILRNERRRLILRALSEDFDGEASLSQLTQHVACIQHGYADPRDLGNQERKAVYVALYQGHVPKLDGAGFVAWSGRSGDGIVLTPAGEVAYEALQSAERVLRGDG